MPEPPLAPSQMDEISKEIPGQQVTLRPTTLADLPMLLTLWNDGRVMQWVGFPDGLGYDFAWITAWFERLQTQPYRHHFIVYHPTLGFCGETYYAADFAHGARDWISN